MAVLLNWLWLGVVVALGSGLLIRALGPLGPRPRYRIWSAALAVSLALPVIPLLVETARAWLASSASAETSRIFVVSIPHAWWMSSALIPAAWALWIAAFAIRLTVGALQLRGVRRSATAFPAALESSLGCWQDVRRHGRRARLVVSDRVRAAAVIGFRTPLIAVSPRLLERVSAADLDRVIVHEWAHVQRRDDVAQLVQLAVRIIAGWHPAVWWIDRQITLERELACDEEVLRITGAGREYASCLVHLAEIAPPRLTVLPAPGAMGAARLRTRVVRLLALAAISSSGRSIESVRFSPALLVALAILTGGLTGVEVAAATAADRWLPALPIAFSSVSLPAALDRRDTPAAPAGAALDRSATPTSGETTDERAASQPSPATESRAVPASEEIVAATLAPLPGAEPAATDAAVIPEPRGEIQAPVAPSSAARQTTSEATVWGSAASAGVAVGEGSRKSGVAVGVGSRKGAVATAGFFTRVGKKIAGSF